MKKVPLLAVFIFLVVVISSCIKSDFNFLKDHCRIKSITRSEDGRLVETENFYYTSSGRILKIEYTRPPFDYAAFEVTKYNAEGWVAESITKSNSIGPYPMTWNYESNLLKSITGGWNPQFVFDHQRRLIGMVPNFGGVIHEWIYLNNSRNPIGELVYRPPRPTSEIKDPYEYDDKVNPLIFRGVQILPHSSGLHFEPMIPNNILRKRGYTYTYEYKGNYPVRAKEISTGSDNKVRIVDIVFTYEGCDLTAQ